MAAKIGGVFLTCAMGPVRAGAAAIQASRMPQGLEELAPEALWGGLRRGVEQAAALAGVQPRDVERLLPMKELKACLDQLARTHQAALEAWRLHAGQLGGLLKGVADLTVDGREVMPSAGLARIARKVRRDKEFAAPVQALADDMLQWEELVARCRQALEGGAELARSYRRRRIRNAAIAVATAAAAIAAITTVIIVRASRARVDAAIASADVCAVLGIAEKDLGRGSKGQLQEVADRTRACEAKRAVEAYAEEGLRQAEENAKEAARLQAELEEKCAALATRLPAGKTTAEDVAVAGARAPLLARIRTKALSPKDLGPTMPELPCEDTKSVGKVRDAFVEAAVAQPWRWVGGVDPADEVRDLLAPRAGDMSERARLVLSIRAGDTAKRAIRKGNAAGVERAKRLCAFAEALQVPGGDPCDAVKELPAAPAEAPAAKKP